mgnify:CR=1 FL=1
MKTQLLNGEFLEFTNTNEDVIEISFNRGNFQLWLNGDIIKICKSFKIISNKLEFLKSK